LYMMPILRTSDDTETLTPVTDAEMVPDPKPCRTCVCVKELPFKTDVSTKPNKSDASAV